LLVSGVLVASLSTHNSFIPAESCGGMAMSPFTKPSQGYLFLMLSWLPMLNCWVALQNQTSRFQSLDGDWSRCVFLYHSLVNEWRSLRVVWLVANVHNLMIPFLSSVVIFRRYRSQDEMRRLLAVMEKGSILDWNAYMMLLPGVVQRNTKLVSCSYNRIIYFIKRRDCCYAIVPMYLSML
jgi:hypothetical protein